MFDIQYITIAIFVVYLFYFIKSKISGDTDNRKYRSNKYANQDRLCLDDIPTSREELTNYIVQNTYRIEAVKRGNRSDFNWARKIGHNIINLGDNGLFTTQMTAHQLMAAIFCVNQNKQYHRCYSVKNYLASVILTYKSDEVSVSNGIGEYKGTIEIRCASFSSHAPINLLKSGAMDRRMGKPLSRRQW